ncbi:hypothetical protein ENH_00058760 [Eimeria necatrix]|uniref:Uncharacterized protein n=1 Tax=Eimeria necatrix TaxID=51315 RepID=U6MHL2_9EIME|nr:hypothetical protein ENH_00058760 [Eimeria necatrix]CDJ63742.1 hypothetical protein ENH_00058760 [Eimeria necatrix]
MDGLLHLHRNPTLQCSTFPVPVPLLHYLSAQQKNEEKLHLTCLAFTRSCSMPSFKRQESAVLLPTRPRGGSGETGNIVDPAKGNFADVLICPLILICDAVVVCCQSQARKLKPDATTAPNPTTPDLLHRGDAKAASTIHPAQQSGAWRDTKIVEPAN